MMSNETPQALYEWAEKCLTLCKSEKYDDAQKLQAIIDALKNIHKGYTAFFETKHITPSDIS